MNGASRGLLRLGRAVLATLIAVALAAAGHGVGGGGVTAGAVVVLVALVLPLALLGTRWQWTTPRTLVAFGATQAAAHLLLLSMEPSGHGAVLSPHRGHTLNDLATLATSLTPPSSGSHVMASLTPTMLLAHVVATVLSAWLVGHGESALWSVFLRLLPVLAPASAPPVPLRALGADRAVDSLVSRVHSGPLPARGPPAALPRWA